MAAIKQQLCPGFTNFMHTNAQLYADGNRERISDNLFTVQDEEYARQSKEYNRESFAFQDIKEEVYWSDEEYSV